ncbi:Predicted DNA-binding transcriptional regulator YafY, contains an HTH and WYL domains [Lachnospiraceae bacterium XPB1003]|nr:Predicted DNA-binding transcriptional regulator YafY, contains an HTH and WYL domains [Lachnospiraceae bacterium XPB1003]
MPKGTNQKLKLYYLSRIMLEKTDDEHMITMPEIKEALEAYGVTADRKSLYDDLQALEVLGIEVIGEKVGRNFYYHVGNKSFEIAELKLLVDSIQSSKFITEKKSSELIKKLTNMASVYEAAQLRRQVVVHGRVKTMNESIYYFVDDIHRAIAENKKISFEYMKWNEEKKLVRRKDTLYVVSPWALTWDDENYYLIAYDDAAERIKHFRVDKLKSIQVLEDRRTGKDAFKAFDLARYAKMSFGMFGGKPTKVRISFENDLVGVFIDRFGRDIPIYSTDREGWSETSVEVAMSDQFLGWIFALGSKVKILGPKEVVERFKDELAAMKQLYDQT